MTWANTMGDTEFEPMTSSVSATEGAAAGWIPWRGHAARDSVDVRERVKSEAAVVRQFVRHGAVDGKEPQTDSQPLLGEADRVSCKR